MDEDLPRAEDRLAVPPLFILFPSSLDSNSGKETCDGDLSMVLCEVEVLVVLVAMLLILVLELILHSVIVCTASLTRSCMLLLLVVKQLRDGQAREDIEYGCDAGTLSLHAVFVLSSVGDDFGGLL